MYIYIPTDLNVPPLDIHSRWNESLSTLHCPCERPTHLGPC